MGQNLVEKIAQKFAIDLPSKHVVRSGDFLSVSPAHVMTHDNTGAVMKKFSAIGAEKMANPRQMVYALDHNVQDKSEANLKKYSNIEAFAKKMGVDFYPAGRGIGHQIMCEEGYVMPGTMVVASDSHSNMYGGLGALGTPVVRTDAASLWATGRTWWKVPSVVKIAFMGTLQEGVTGKDLILALCGIFKNDEVLNHAIEFTGEGIASLSIDQRLTIANMTTEWGALAGVFPCDKVTISWLKNRCDIVKQRGLAGVPSDVDGNGEHPRLTAKNIDELAILSADPDAYYAKVITVDISTVVPCVSGPHNVKTMKTAIDFEKENKKIHKAYLVSCVNSRLEDIEQAAKAIEGKKVAPGVEFYISAASDEIQKMSEDKGYWKTLLDAGAIPLTAGCGPCIGLGVGLLDDNEVGISATNRNFKGRMGAKTSEAYLASPAVVAASAVAGKIASHKQFDNREFKAELCVNPKPVNSKPEVELIDGFPATQQGNILFCYQDNLNTDGIYPGKYTYNDDFTPEQQAEVVMENYDATFGKVAQKGDILVGGYNFGTGSSREQAATALKYRGIQMVLAGSFSETYKRNAFNNGFLVIDAPDLVDDLKAKLGTGSLTIREDIQAKIDFQKCEIIVDGKIYSMDPVGKAAQELILAGGLEKWVKNEIGL